MSCRIDIFLLIGDLLDCKDRVDFILQKIFLRRRTRVYKEDIKKAELLQKIWVL